MVLNILIIVNVAFHGFIYADDSSSYMINLLKLKHRTSSSDDTSSRNSSLAVDGLITTCTQPTRYDTIDPWWQIELDIIYNITDVRLHSTDEVYRSKRTLKVFISNKTPPNQTCNSSTGGTFENIPGGIYEWHCDSGVVGKYVRIVEEKYWLLLCEVEILIDLASVNLALYRPLKHSLQHFRTGHRSNDGIPGSCTALLGHVDKDYWITVELKGFFHITHVKLLYMNIFGQIHVFVSANEINHEEQLCAMIREVKDTKNKEKVMQYLECQKPKVVSIVTIKKLKENISRVFSICEIEIFSKFYPMVKPKTTPSPCLQTEYLCKDGSCINKDWLCDGTYDCLNADDEAPSCENKDKEMFKCKRKNEKIKIYLRCDGIAQCTDYSDEEDCFDIDSNPMNATFKGVSNFHVCSDEWRYEYTQEICNDYNQDYADTLTVHHNHVHFLVLRINHLHLFFLDNRKSITYILEEGDTCESKTFVKIECREKEDMVYTCGKRHYEDPFLGPYILKGHNARFPAWPWHAQIINKNDFHKNCGGSIISDRWILTSADCVSNIGNSESVFVVVGSNYNRFTEENLEISRIIVHPNFDKDGYFNIAMVLLKLRLRFSEVIQPICLPEFEMPRKILMSFHHCVFTGYGWLDEGGSRPTWLKQARMNIIETDECAKDMQSSFPDIKNYYEAAYNILVYNSLLCAGEIPLINGRNTCHGDFGGALMCKSNYGVWTQVGISVYVKKLKPEKRDCTHNFFVRVDQHLDFIESTTHKM